MSASFRLSVLFLLIIFSCLIPAHASDFSIISPESEERVMTKALFDWEDSTDPNATHYAVSLSVFPYKNDDTYYNAYDCDSHPFENATRIEDITESTCFSGFDEHPELTDLTNYCWKVQALSEDGIVLQESDTGKLRTRNSGDTRGWVRCYVRDSGTTEGIKGATVYFGNIVLTERGAGLYCDGVVPDEDTPITLSVNAQGYQSHEDEVTISKMGVVTRTFTLEPTTIATPLLSPAPGVFTTPQSLEMSCTTPDAMIRYTTDGNEPTESSQTYSSPVLIETTTVIKAKAFKTDMEPSETVEGKYYIVTLKDVISVLQIVAGTEPAPSVSKETDVNADDKIGLAEAVFMLQGVAK